MSMSEVCIRRPVFSCVISLVLMVIGILSFTHLSTRYFPPFESHRLRIVTNYAGASAKLIETNITTPLENAISGIPGIDTVESTSTQGSSIIQIKLKADGNAYDISSQVRNKVSRARQELPDDADDPEVNSGHGDSELMDFAFTDTSRSTKAVQDYLERFVVNQISDLAGVASVDVFGAGKYAIRIRLNPASMHAYNISVSEVITAIQDNNIELPAGEIDSKNLYFPVTAKTGLSTPKQFDDIPIKKVNGSLVTLGDIGKATLGNDSTSPAIVKFNGKPTVWMMINATTDANPIKTAKLVQQKLQLMASQFPASTKMHLFFNEADFMKSSIKEVYISIAIAILCVMLVIYLFLGNLRTAVIPIITIPVCLLSSFAVMALFGFSINVITLLALVLSVGLVVDDAIVMLENIHRYIEQGDKPFLAAIVGSKEITFAVVAMTLTLAAVYAPIGFLSGHMAIIFRSFAFTLAGAVLISGFIALTLTPMMCSRLIPAHNKENPRSYAAKLEVWFESLSNLYRRILKTLLQFRLLMIIIAILLAIGGYFLFKTVPSEFVPQDDIGLVFSRINTPTGATNTFTENILSKTRHVIDANPGVNNVITIADSHPAPFNAALVTLKPYDERNKTAVEIANQLNQSFKQVPGLDVTAFPATFGGSSKAQLQFSVMTAGSYIDLYNTSQVILKKLQNYPGLSHVSSSMNFDSQQYEINVKHDIASQLQVSTKTIDQTIAALFGGNKVSTFNVDGRNYNVYVQAIAGQLSNIDHLTHLYVNNTEGQSVPLSNLITVKSFTAQPSLSHYNRARSMTLSAQLAPHHTLGQVVKYLQSNLPQWLPSSDNYAFMGKAKKLIEASSSSTMLFALAFVFIYLILAAQFESFLDPLIILFVVPLSVISALAALKLFGGSRNIYTDIGLVTLIGLIAKHGILITQFANELQKQGIDMMEAVLKAAALRLRPILMTTAAMVFGALPLVFAQGASSLSREQIGIVIISGLVFGTFFSLILVPVVYTYMAQFKRFCKLPT
ncbi:MAG: efflux RND transporter permease subunit [Coxiellaceae bacterium]|nr:efflux RND transporter permease subunit [Coxiellaceae bacterium]